MNPTDPSRLDAEALYAALLAQVKTGLAGAADVAIVGIHSGGAWLAERLAADLGLTPRLGFIDVSFYRDDYAQKGLHADVKPTQIGFDVNGATLLLVDDVLYTGRTTRAAINELFDYGRPARIMLAALVDRGGRQLPIAADFVAPPSRSSRTTGMSTLDAAEFAINNSVQASTGFSPFRLVYGEHVRTAWSAALPSPTSANATADELVQARDDALQRAKDNLLKAQQQQSRYANKKRQEVKFQVGDKVLLSTANLNNELRAPKLIPRYVGPFPIVRVVNDVAYELALPASMSRVHPTFHVSKLKRWARDSSERFLWPRAAKTSRLLRLSSMRVRRGGRWSAS